MIEPVMGELQAKKQAEKSTVLSTANFIMFFKNFKHVDIATIWSS
jgi:hypothetical protein